jgi:cation diffusion facilitator family transporter
MTGVELRSLDLGLALITLATAANAAIGMHLIRVGRRVNSVALVADGRHLLTDVLTSAGVVIGLGLVWLTGVSILDPIVALVVALHILVTGWQLARQAIGGLMDEADPGLLETMADALESRREPSWIDAHSLRSWRSGAVEHVDLHLVVPRYFDADQLHAIDDRVEQALLSATQRPGEVITHFDPCRPRYCPFCRVEPCPVREAPFAAARPLTTDRATRSDEALESGRPVASVKVGE